ncbi:response regulator transcription factor [Actinomycetospora sp. Odt1-22]|uniref:Response regulator transcription factor n=1 Tax=Actinomycetospora termitidis TaxID=3053470 RepID=A0ABT7MC72_9PSEU|nr:response regulator transcription factor [Actinomycetospora sp. Odt1-22]MDL5158270.1 response regulator transcription factor [Actinomycetospora sp. Odt1-22]
MRVVIAEDGVLLREGLTLLVQARPELELVAVCEDLPTLLDAVAADPPDVVLTDIRMPPTGTDEGLRAARRFRSSHPDLGVVVLSQYVEPDYASQLFEDGSRRRAYLLKERVSDVEQVVAAMREVAAGGSVVDPRVVEELVAARRRGGDGPLSRLTERELAVLAGIAQGRNNAAIAEALVLTVRAVEKHINAIFAKLGLAADPGSHHRVRAALLFLAESSGAGG